MTLVAYCRSRMQFYGLELRTVEQHVKTFEH